MNDCLTASSGSWDSSQCVQGTIRRGLMRVDKQWFSFDMKNIAPKDGLTCLSCKSTSEKQCSGIRRHCMDVKSAFLYGSEKHYMPDQDIEAWYGHFGKLSLVQWFEEELLQERNSQQLGLSVFGEVGSQVLWIQNQLLDYGYNFMNTVIYIDNNSTICIIENPVQHSKTKHIEIRHHFIRDCNAKKLIQMAKIDSEHNVADLLTKGFDAGRFQYLVSSIGMLNP
ncbi:hypothetical protein Tco_0522856 [Tanacetum coccineum]